ncbi:hypothetical protein COLAER_01554 [Collinsella aerofaciens ATCC 25986]|uniref:Uncharacterized protein n=1 Tax=Collinsella aerofaciens (strain ATCC 25986 / DSM 3979 / JCM 10188 / KCTC 3647 / NCTC 11838 / VPI 1003) TaxID=411903 RepID=A4EAU5_COLAA|nr:hypothetical protein COLAER_01554 [Collinsella aerofaciens ATCC 25986]
MGVDDAGAVRANLQNALDVAEALGLRSGDVDLFDELGFLLAGRLDLELLGLLAQFGDLHGSELLARKRGLGGGGVALLVALFAIALTVATVVVALVLAIVALLVALVLATVGTSAVFALSGGGTIGCGGAGIGRSGVIGLGAGINLRFGISLLLGRLGLSGLLTTALGLLGRRLFDVLGLSGINRCIGGRLGGILGRTLLGSLGLERALSSSTMAATRADVGGLDISRNGLGSRSILDGRVGSGCRLGGRRSIPSGGGCGCGLLGLDESLGLATATVRAQSRIDNGNFAGLGRRSGLNRRCALPCRGTDRSLSELGGYLIGNLLGLSSRATACARYRLLGWLVGDRGLGGGRRLGHRRSCKLGQSRGLALGSTTAGAHHLSLANLRQRTCLRDLIGNRRRGVSCNGALGARRARGTALGLGDLLAVSGRLGRAARALGLCRSSLLTSCRHGLLSRYRRRRRSSLRRLRSRGLRGRRDLVRRNRCSGSGLRRRYFVFLLLIRHSVCSTFFSSPVITCSLHKPSGRLNSLAPSKTDGHH